MENEKETNNKYELLYDDFITLTSGTPLYRVKALKDFGNVKKGDLGGYIQSPANLSQLGNCWVTHQAKVYGYAVVVDDAEVQDYAKVFGKAIIKGNAIVRDFAHVYENAEVTDKATVCGGASVYGNARVYGRASVANCAQVYGRVILRGNTYVTGGARVFDDALILNAEVSGNCKIFGDAQVFDSASIVSGAISGRAQVSRAHLVDCIVSNIAEISIEITIFGQTIGCNADYIIFKNWWSSGRYFAYFTQSDEYQVGCFRGSGKELVEKAYEDSEISGRQYENIVKYVENIKSQLVIMADKNNSPL